MSEAINILKYIFSKFTNFVFNDLEIAANVTIGWIAVVIIVFSLMIRSILNVPRGIRFRRDRGVNHE